MKPFSFAVVLFLLIPGMLHAQAPDSKIIETAMNEGVELDFGEFQELTEVKIRSGGVTTTGDYVFICEANVVWKIDGVEFTKIVHDALEQQFARDKQTQFFFKELLSSTLSQSLSEVGSFKKGDMVTKVRFRARLEKAGNAWIATSSKIRELSSNPLRSRPEKARQEDAGAHRPATSFNSSSTAA
jgi:hypothetical protein